MKICIYGAQGHLDSVFAALSAVGEAKVTGICFEVGENIEWVQNALKSKGQDFKLYTAFDEMIEQEKPDIAAISTYPHINAAAINSAIKAGINVFCEKPIAINMQEFKEISTSIKKSDVKLYSMMTERFDAPFHTAYAALAKGCVGTLRLIDARKSYKLGTRPDYYKSRKTYAGTLAWVGIHAIDRIYHAAQKKFKMVFARSSNGHNNGHGDLETTAVCSFEMDGDILASFTCDYYRPNSALTHGDDRLRVVGTHGILEVVGGAVRLMNKDGEALLSLIRAPQIFEEFIEYIKTGKSEYLTTEDCLYTTYAALKTTMSSERKQTMFFDEVNE